MIKQSDDTAVCPYCKRRVSTHTTRYGDVVFSRHMIAVGMDAARMDYAPVDVKQCIM